MRGGGGFEQRNTRSNTCLHTYIYMKAHAATACCWARHHHDTFNKIGIHHAVPCPLLCPCYIQHRRMAVPPAKRGDTCSSNPGTEVTHNTKRHRTTNHSTTQHIIARQGAAGQKQDHLLRVRACCYILLLRTNVGWVACKTLLCQQRSVDGAKRRAHPSIIGMPTQPNPTHLSVRVEAPKLDPGYALLSHPHHGVTATASYAHHLPSR